MPPKKLLATITAAFSSLVKIWPLYAWLYVYLCAILLPRLKCQIIEDVLFYSIPFVFFVFVCIGYLKSLPQEKKERSSKFYIKQIMALLITSIVNSLGYLLSGYIVLKLLIFYDVASVYEAHVMAAIFCVIYILGVVVVTNWCAKKGNYRAAKLVAYSGNFVIFVSLMAMSSLYYLTRL